MQLARKLGLSLIAGILSIGVVGLAAPAAHADTSWGCGGACKHLPTHP